MSLTRSDIKETIPDLFERHVLQRPDHTAFEHGDARASYRDLGRRINEVAAMVTAREPDQDSPVLVLMAPGFSSIAAFIGILRAGAICALVDKSNPRSRLESIIENVRPGLCIADRDSVELARDLADGTYPVAVIGENETSPAKPRNSRLADRNPAVIVYTSGSTGVPKGVLHSQQSLVHVVWFHAQRLKLGPTDRTLFLPSSTGIAGALLILRTLLTGGTLVQFSSETISGQDLYRVINASEITSITMVPSLFREMMTGLQETDRLPTLRTIILGGEPLTARDVRLFQQHCGPECTLLNVYGCTEVPTFRTFTIDMKTELHWRQVPVGYAVENKEVVLIDDAGKPVAPGDEGEIAVRSEFMALGYWRNAEETALRFIPPDEPGGARMYRTGDQGRFLEGTVLACTGRRDQQVKVMGNRVELGEIESALCQHPHVKRAAVIAKISDEGATFLVAFVVAEELAVNGENELRRFLLSRLPAYMIPARISPVATLPLTPNGKIDTEALRALESEPANDTDSSTHTKMPSLLERYLLEIWSEVLGLQVINVSDNFFELGGDSLKATSISNRLESILGFRIPLVWFFEMPTVADLAPAVQRCWQEVNGS